MAKQKLKKKIPYKKLHNASIGYPALRKYIITYWACACVQVGVLASMYDYEKLD